MRYTCSGCGTEFEAEPAGKLRCPKCLRQHGLIPEALGEEPAGAPAPAPTPRGRRRVLALAGVVVLIAAAGLGAWRLLIRRAAPTAAVLTDAQLTKALGARGVPSGDVVLPFAADEGVRTLARAAQGAGALGRAQALAGAVRQLLADGQATRWRRQRVPEQRPRPAAELLSALNAKSAGDVYGYEVAALTLAAARAAGLSALLAEVVRQGGRPADPSGTVGAWAVAVYDGPPRPDAAPAGYVDAFGEGVIEQARPLDDVAAAAGWYVLTALAHCGGDGDTAAAYRHAEHALKLAPGATLGLTARGQALLAGGGAREALVDLRAAAARADDAPRHTNLAAAYLAAQEPEQAEAALRTALARDAGFAPAHLALAAVLSLRRDDTGAQQALEAAERADAAAPGLRLIRAQLLAQQGDLGGAEGEVRAEIAADPGEERAGLMLFGLLKAAGKDADAETVKDELLKRSRHEGRLRQIFEAATGATGGGGRPR